MLTLNTAVSKKDKTAAAKSEAVTMPGGLPPGITKTPSMILLIVNMTHIFASP
jgi:hypothetical protein